MIAAVPVSKDIFVIGFFIETYDKKDIIKLRNYLTTIIFVFKSYLVKYYIYLKKPLPFIIQFLTFNIKGNQEIEIKEISLVECNCY